MLPCTNPYDTHALTAMRASNELAIHGHPQRKLNKDPDGTCEL